MMLAKKKFMVSIVFMALLLSIYADVGDVETTTEMVPRPIPKEVLDKFVADVNQRRRTFAKEHNIANMHELIWSQTLADAVAIDGKDGHVEDTNEKNYAADYSFQDYLDRLDVIIKFQIPINLNKGPNDEKYNDDIDLLSPTHREIGCAETVHENAYWKKCYISPGALYGMQWDTKGLDAVKEIMNVTGDPGSQCYEGYGNNDGLCTLLPTTTTTTTTEEPTTTTTEEPTTEEPTTPEPVPTTEEPELPEPEDKDPKDNNAPAPDVPKPQQSLVTEKQTSDDKDSGESEGVTESEESRSSALLLSFYSVLVFISFVYYLF